MEALYLAIAAGGFSFAVKPDTNEKNNNKFIYIVVVINNGNFFSWVKRISSNSSL
jgi:hypothetical protein